MLRQNSPARGFVQIWQFSGSHSDYFLPRVRFSCCFTATSACALQAASLKKCTHTTFVPNFAYRTKHLMLQSMCFCPFCRMSYTTCNHAQGTGMKPSPWSLAGNGSCAQNSPKGISCHLSEDFWRRKEAK